MKKDLMKTNCYDVEDTLIIVGSCFDRMQPEAYKELEMISDNLRCMFRRNTYKYAYN